MGEESLAKHIMYGVEAPYGDMQFKQLERKEAIADLHGTKMSGKSLKEHLSWLINSQNNQSHSGISQSVDEFDRIIRSVVILSRAYPDAKLNEMFETALVWERG